MVGEVSLRVWCGRGCWCWRVYECYEVEDLTDTVFAMGALELVATFEMEAGQTQMPTERQGLELPRCMLGDFAFC